MVNGPEPKVVEPYQPDYTNFPSHATLRRENMRYYRYKQEAGVKETEDEPFPTYLDKKDIFDPRNFADVDNHALEVIYISRFQPKEIFYIKSIDQYT